jgi:uracil-DNA glycosylase family 4
MDDNAKRDDLRKRILACNQCSCFDEHIGGARYGTGSGNELMLVGLNPPVDPARRQHGAHMLHYNRADKSHPEDILIEDLVEYLCLKKTQVYSTYVVKCAVSGDLHPNSGMMRNCWSFLIEEAKLKDPKVTILFGADVQLQFLGYFDAIKYLKHGTEQKYKIKEIGNSYFAHAWRTGSIIGVPSPRVVGKFVDRESWLETIKVAYHDALKGKVK